MADLEQLLSARFSAEQLLEQGFTAKSRPFSTWTEGDVEAVKNALICLAKGTMALTTPTQDVHYWLSHHILGRRHSVKACKWFLEKLAADIEDNTALQQDLQEHEADASGLRTYCALGNVMQ